MRKCSCGFVLYPFMGVNLQEFACFKCGNVEEFFNDCEEIEDENLEKEAADMKAKFYKEQNINRGMSQTEFIGELKRLGMMI